MLQKVDFEDGFETSASDRSHLLSPAYYLALIGRRWAYFLVPFVLIAAAGVSAAWLWPATYRSEGRILVQSQQIPTELVRPTVTSAAQERIQVIEQRTMTRDNLLAIADKFKLFPEKRSLMTVSELVDLIKNQTKIAPVSLALDFKQRSRGENPTIVFSVGFEYSDPTTAARVANELMTRILNEDLRDRTSRATDTTKFLSRELLKLQADNAILDGKIAQAKVSQGIPTSSGRNDQPSLLDQLKSELVQKSALYSNRHPQIQSLKRQIDAVEKANPQVAASAGSASAPSAAATTTLDALLAQQESLKNSMETAQAKLAAARLGESLEKDQQSEKLEIIEQPTAPQEPIKPNRPKLMALAVGLALMAGIGLMLGAEFFDKAIRRSSDIFGIIDSQIVVSIPYIISPAETRRKIGRIVLAVIALVIIFAGMLAAAYFYLPPLDLIVAKARVGLFR